MSIRIKVRSTDPYSEFNESWQGITTKIGLLRTNQTQTNAIYETFDTLVAACFTLASKLAEERNFGGNVIEKVELFARDKINDYRTVFKRNKICEQSPIYVKPVDKAIGLKWKSHFDITSNAVHYKLDQCTYQYIPLLDTLITKFQDEKFRQAYLNNGHSCSPG